MARKTLRKFWERQPQSEAPLKAWFTLVSKAKWTGPTDVKALFGTSVDFVAGNRVIFNKYRLVAYVAYPYGRVLIKFVGTHAEYDDIDPETV